jgi:two-component system, OmpR family, sensor kinase
MQSVLRHVIVFLRRVEEEAPPIGVGILGIVVTIIAAVWVHANVYQQAELRFIHESEQITSRIRTRLEKFEIGLKNTKAFFLTNELKVSRKQFETYINNIDLLIRYAGSLGIGFDSKNLHLEPYSRNKIPSVMADIQADPTAQRARYRARDTGLSVASGKIGEEMFVLYVPVYRLDFPTRTVEERQQSLFGYVYSPFRVRELVTGIFGSEFDKHSPVHFEIYDGESLSPETLMFSNEKIPSESRFSQVLPLHFASHRWQVKTYSGRLIDDTIGRFAALFVVISGMAVTLLLLAIVRAVRTHGERERKYILELRDAVKVRDEFLSIASHELRTPLTSLKLQTQLLGRYLDKGALRSLTDEKLKKMTSTFDHQLSRLTSLVDDLLDVSRISSGRLTLNRERTDLGELVEQVIARFIPELQMEGISVNIEKKGNLVGYVDRLRIEQVVANLISNARKYAPKMPIEVCLSGSEKSGFVVLSVKDRGIGIAEEDQPRIFQRFERVSSDKNISGLGLGLFITSQIASAHGGTIRVESKIGQGAKFIVELPVEENV